MTIDAGTLSVIGTLIVSTAVIVWRFTRLEARLEGVPERVTKLEHDNIRIKAHVGLRDAA